MATEQAAAGDKRSEGNQGEKKGGGEGDCSSNISSHRDFDRFEVESKLKACVDNIEQMLADHAEELKKDIEKKIAMTKEREEDNFKEIMNAMKSELKVMRDDMKEMRKTMAEPKHTASLGGENSEIIGNFEQIVEKGESAVAKVADDGKMEFTSAKQCRPPDPQEPAGGAEDGEDVFMSLYMKYREEGNDHDDALEIAGDIFKKGRDAGSW